MSNVGETRRFREAYDELKALLSELQPQMQTLIRQTAAHGGSKESAIVRRAMLEPLFLFHAALGSELAAAERALGFAKNEVS